MKTGVGEIYKPKSYVAKAKSELEDINPAYLSIGDKGTVVSDKKEKFIFNGVDWVMASSGVGEQGPQGEPGPQGERGPKGETGAKGAKGDPGKDAVLDKAALLAIISANPEEFKTALGLGE